MEIYNVKKVTRMNEEKLGLQHPHELMVLI